MVGVAIALGVMSVAITLFAILVQLRQIDKTLKDGLGMVADPLYRIDQTLKEK